MANVKKNEYPFKENIFMPSDIYEVDNMYVINIDLPGLRKEDIKVNYSNGYLTVNVNKRIDTPVVGKYIHRERFFGQIKRSFFIGKKKQSNIKVNYDNGILNVIFPVMD